MWRKPQGIPLVIAHRGASAICTENTTQAFERAARDRADGVELDVLLCRSGEVVVFHDDDLRRMLDRPERVADLSYRVLRSLRLRRDSFIPTLAEAFEACGPDLLVNVELKSEGVFDRSVAPLVDRVAEVWRRWGWDHGCWCRRSIPGRSGCGAGAGRRSRRRCCASPRIRSPLPRR